MLWEIFICYSLSPFGCLCSIRTAFCICLYRSKVWNILGLTSFLRAKFGTQLARNGISNHFSLSLCLKKKISPAFTIDQVLLLSAFACVPSFNSLNNPKWWILLSSSLRLSLGVEPKCGCFVTPNLGLTSVPLHLWLAGSGMEYDRKEKWRVERRWESWRGEHLLHVFKTQHLLTPSPPQSSRSLDEYTNLFFSQGLFFSLFFEVLSVSTHFESISSQSWIPAWIQSVLPPYILAVVTSRYLGRS